MELTYEPVYSLENVVNVFEREIKRKEGNLFVEGISFSKDKAVIMTGKLVDNPTNVIVYLFIFTVNKMINFCTVYCSPCYCFLANDTQGCDVVITMQVLLFSFNH